MASCAVISVQSYQFALSHHVEAHVEARCAQMDRSKSESRRQAEALISHLNVLKEEHEERLREQAIAVAGSASHVLEGLVFVGNSFCLVVSQANAGETRTLQGHSFAATTASESHINAALKPRPVSRSPAPP